MHHVRRAHDVFEAAKLASLQLGHTREALRVAHTRVRERGSRQERASAARVVVPSGADAIEHTLKVEEQAGSLKLDRLAEHVLLLLGGGHRSDPYVCRLQADHTARAVDLHFVAALAVVEAGHHSAQPVELRLADDTLHNNGCSEKGQDLLSARRLGIGSFLIRSRLVIQSIEAIAECDDVCFGTCGSSGRLWRMEFLRPIWEERRLMRGVS